MKRTLIRFCKEKKKPLMYISHCEYWGGFHCWNCKQVTHITGIRKPKESYTLFAAVQPSDTFLFDNPTGYPLEIYFKNYDGTGYHLLQRLPPFGRLTFTNFSTYLMTLYFKNQNPTLFTSPL